MSKAEQNSIPSLSQAFGLLLMVFMLMFMFGALVFLLFPSNNSTDISANQLALTIFISMAASYLLLVLFSSDYWQHRFLPTIKLDNYWFFGSLILGIVAAFSVLALQAQFPAPKNLDTSIGLALSADLWLSLLVYISVIFIAPFFEEYLFRGIFFDSLLKQWGLTVAVLISAFIFTLFHLFEYYQYWVAWFSVFCLALILAIVRHKSQSMLNPIVLHTTYNTTLLMVGSN